MGALPPWMYWSMPPGFATPPAAPKPSRRHRDTATSSPSAASDAPPSSPTADDSGSRKRKSELSIIHYPAISEWLESLDKDEERGIDDVNYAQYSTILRKEGILRLRDLLGISSVEKLQELAQLNYGTAQRLLTYAKEDETKLANDAKKARRT